MVEVLPCQFDVGSRIIKDMLLLVWIRLLDDLPGTPITTEFGGISFPPL